MNLESLLSQLERIRLCAEAKEFQEYYDSYIENLIIKLLLDYINNTKITEKIDEIIF